MSFALAFSPTGDNVTASLNTSSQTFALPGDSTVAATMRVYNAGAAPIFFITGPSAAVTADALDVFVAPGATEVFNIPVGHTHVAALIATATGTAYFQRGGGL